MEHRVPTTSQADWTIRPAREADYRAARLLLPQAVHFGSGCIVMIAESGSDHRVIGAIASAPRSRSEGLFGARVAVHVIPPWRRRGIAKALVSAIDQAVRAWGAQGLFAWRAVEQGSKDERAWRMLGFNRQSTTQLSFAKVERAQGYLKPLYDQMIERNWIPPEAKLIPLRRADLQAIASMHAELLGGIAQQILWRLTGQSVEPFDSDLSPVLVMDRRVRAFTLVRLIGSVCYVEATVVEPDLRFGWANLWLKYEGLRWASAAGAKTLVFQTYARHADTRKVARQIGAVTKELVEPYRLLT